MIKFQDKGNMLALLEIYMMVLGKMVCIMDMGNSQMIKVRFMKDNGKIINKYTLINYLFY